MAQHTSKIDTKDFGLATLFYSPSHSGVANSWKVGFDTGIVMIIPDGLFPAFQFHLAEGDPRAPQVG